MNKFQEKGADAVVNTATAFAQIALDAGQMHYCPVLPKASGLAAGVDTWGLAITAIEKLGFVLEHWAVDPAGNARPVFRLIPTRYITGAPA